MKHKIKRYKIDVLVDLFRVSGYNGSERDDKKQFVDITREAESEDR